MDDIKLLTKIPLWAKWLAQDSNGDWCVYAEKPKIMTSNNKKWTNQADSTHYQWAKICTTTEIMKNNLKAPIDLRSLS